VNVVGGREIEKNNRVDKNGGKLPYFLAQQDSHLDLASECNEE
jgi:hypothetical protein